MIDLSEVRGWFNFQPYYDLVFSNLRAGSRVFEIGVHEGRSTLYFADLIRSSGKLVDFHCCDTFTFSERFGDREVNFLKNLERFDLKDYLRVHKGDSVQVLREFEDSYFDFIFIDGDHRCRGASLDIKESIKKLKYGGILAGHDVDMESVKCALETAKLPWKLFPPNVWHTYAFKLI